MPNPLCRRSEELKILQIQPLIHKSTAVQRRTIGAWSRILAIPTLYFSVWHWGKDPEYSILFHVRFWIGWTLQQQRTCLRERVNIYTCLIFNQNNPEETICLMKLLPEISEEKDACLVFEWIHIWSWGVFQLNRLAKHWSHRVWVPRGRRKWRISGVRRQVQPNTAAWRIWTHSATPKCKKCY